MATTKAKGYHSYHGRSNIGKIALCVALAAIIVAAVVYLVVQNYMVYDDEGNAHMELPHYYQKENKEDAIAPEDVNLEILEPVIKRPTLKELHAVELPVGCLKWKPDYALGKATDEAVIVDVKQKNGALTYPSTVSGVPYAEAEPALTNLKALLGSDKYTVARIACFCDSLYDTNNKEVALYRSSGLRWYDGTGYAWIDPSSAASQEYLAALVQECVDLGFDEVMLDYFSYPTNGDWVNLPNIADDDKAQVLADFAETLRKSLPENVGLSTVVRSEISADFGLSEQWLLETFDRVYVVYGLDPAPLQAAAEASDAKYVAQVVPMAYRVPAQGGYVKLWYVAPKTTNNE